MVRHTVKKILIEKKKLLPITKLRCHQGSCCQCHHNPIILLLCIILIYNDYTLYKHINTSYMEPNPNQYNSLDVMNLTFSFIANTPILTMNENAD